MKHYINAALVYTGISLASGLFYRDFTKLSEFTGNTRLSLIHGHYLALGGLVFLVLLLLEKQFAWSQSPMSKKAVWAYHVGLNLTGIGFLMRGLMDVRGEELSRGINAAIAGVSGLGHMILGVGLMLILLKVRKSVLASIKA